MAIETSGVPKVARSRRGQAPSPRAVARTPARIEFRSHDEGPWSDDVDQLSFALQWFGVLVAMVIVVTSFAVFVLAPLVGAIMRP
jgi:hypothetical protein